MKALSVKQPWASLLITGTPDGVIKKAETRSWPTDHRGPLLIVASKTEDGEAMAYFGFARGCLPLGQMVGMVNVWDCVRMVADDERLALCPMYDGAWVWRCKNPVVVEAAPVVGRLGLYDVPQAEIKIKV